MSVPGCSPHLRGKMDWGSFLLATRVSVDVASSTTNCRVFSARGWPMLVRKEIDMKVCKCILVTILDKFEGSYNSNSVLPPNSFLFKWWFAWIAFDQYHLSSRNVYPSNQYTKEEVPGGGGT